MIMILSLDVLGSASPCREQWATIRAEWPMGIPITNASALRAAELGLDIRWAARRLLSPVEWTRFERTRSRKLVGLIARNRAGTLPRSRANKSYSCIQALALLSGLLRDSIDL